MLEVDVLESGGTNKDIQKAMNKLGKPFRKDKWYITRGMRCVVVSAILQVLALLLNKNVRKN
jgi:hypothetical protein